jgi:hypothetical protein
MKSQRTIRVVWLISALLVPFQLPAKKVKATSVASTACGAKQMTKMLLLSSFPVCGIC